MNVAPINLLKSNVYKNNLINKKQNNKNYFQNNSIELGYDSINLTKISFGSSANKLSQNQENCVNFGLLLAQKLKNKDNIDIFQEVTNFLEQYDIENIDIQPISQHENLKDNIYGLFYASFDGDLKYKGGTMYLGEVPKNGDEKSILAYCAILSHELSHVIYYKEKNDLLVNIFSKRNLNNSQTTSVVFGEVNLVADEIRKSLQTIPVQFCCDNRTELGFSSDDFLAVNFEKNKYGISFPKKVSRKLDSKYIYKAFGGEKEFERQVDKNIKIIFRNFQSYYPEATKDELYAMKDLFIYQLRNEAQAYQVQSEIVKKVNKLDKRFNALSDVVPMTYNLIADKLEKVK